LGPTTLPGGALLLTVASAGAGIAIARYTPTPWWVVLGSGVVWNLTVGVPKVNALAAVGAFAVYKWLM
jgi:hypothetical protein